MKKVGVIGLGNMGMGMAKNLIKSGFSVIGFDLDAKRLLKLKENGGSTATSTVQVGEETDAVFVMVMNGEQVKAVVADLAYKNKKRTWIFHVRLSRGSGGGTRTPDLVVNSHSLYQLSYSGMGDLSK